VPLLDRGLADPEADKHGGTEKGGMALWLVPLAIFSSSILSSTIPASNASHQPAPWQTIQHLAKTKTSAAVIGCEIAAV